MTVRIELYNLRVTYDAKVDALYLYLQPCGGKVHHTVSPGFDVYLDFDVKGCLLGVEIQNAKTRCGDWIIERAKVSSEL